METYLKFSDLKSDKWVQGIIANFHGQHFKEVYAFRHDVYPVFREKVIRTYKQPNLRGALVKEWAEVRQEDNEDLVAFMWRVQDLVE